MILENKITAYTKESLDELYLKWVNAIDNNAKDEFEQIMGYIKGINIDYEALKIKKVSHLYAIWIIGRYSYMQSIDQNKLGAIITDFYSKYNQKEEGSCFEEYKKSMSSNTKGIASRKRRVQALLDYCQQNGLSIKNDI